MKAYIERPISERPEKAEITYFVTGLTSGKTEMIGTAVFSKDGNWYANRNYPSALLEKWFTHWLQEIEIPDPVRVVNTDVLVKALERITEPIKHMLSDLKEGEQLNGQYTIQLSNDPEYLKSIARKALEQFTTPSPYIKEENK